MDEYIIEGDWRGDSYLVYICGPDIARAEAGLERAWRDPALAEYTNFRIKTVPQRECWWRDPGLVN